MFMSILAEQVLSRYNFPENKMNYTELESDLKFWYAGV